MSPRVYLCVCVYVQNHLIYLNFTVSTFFVGFHEAIGDTIALSVSTPLHLKRIENYLTNNASNATNEQDLIPYDGFLKNEVDSSNNISDYKQNINFLMKTALAKVSTNVQKSAI